MLHGIEVVGITPFGEASVTLARALCTAGATGVVSLADDLEEARRALAELHGAAPGRLGVAVSQTTQVDPEMLPDSVELVVLPAGVPVGPWRPRTVLVQATSVAEARSAAADGADGVIAKGSESAGRVGDEGAFVLLQHLVAELRVPVYVQGGIGLHSAAAALAGGAAGIVVDSQLALMPELGLPPDTRAAIARMDGSETEVVDGIRLLSRPDVFGGRPVHAGQDLALAGPLADAFPSVRALVAALQEGTVRDVRRARTLRPLGPGGPLAREHGVMYPIAQGPMTRVSDVASFADAVAEGGGLPFLALALMRPAEIERLLEQTSQRLGDSPWGVGILGFVPAELREQQLEVVQRFRPPLALIAGGRPSQAQPLEEAGIATYLHVPSPELLKQFLRRGARRFVFEGRECGGHVGPRSSFVLWEQQLDVLLDFEAGEELNVLFAGGIHDARSAAMVEAMAAPLADHGANVGVLMGTAYLFTAEAVDHGAIQPGFQDAALHAERTVLLETSPGHATRCADTPYVRQFIAERDRLAREGASSRELWEHLEQLNLGRLRVASKGLRRDGERLVVVDEEEQRSEGMVMIGQAATLRHELTTIEALHRDVSVGAGTVLERVQLPEVPPRRRPRPADVAIVGMAGVFPGAPDISTFWSNIVAGRNAISEVPASAGTPRSTTAPTTPPPTTSPRSGAASSTPSRSTPSASGSRRSRSRRSSRSSCWRSRSRVERSPTPATWSVRSTASGRR